MTQEKYDIFISYRRKDENGKEWGTSVARNILQALEDRGYKGRVFFDHNKIGPEDFEKKILGAIKQAKVFLCILTKNAMDNCVNEGDWGRREICQAIESGLKIIFLNPDNEFNHKLLPYNFPKEIEIVKTYNSLEIRSGEKFNVDIDDIIGKYIRPIVPPCNGFSASKYQAEQAIAKVLVKSDCDCLVYNFEQEIGTAKANEYTEFNLPIGENELKFVASNFPNISNTQIVKLERDSQKRVVVELKAKCDEYLLNLPDNEFDCFLENRKYGFKLKARDYVVVPCKYNHVYRFSEGLAAVELNGKWGYIDKTGKEVIPCKYDGAYKFSDGLAVVYIYIGLYFRGKYGFIDKTGKEVIPLKYDKADSFCDGLAKVNLKDKWSYIDKSGKSQTLRGYKREYAKLDSTEKRVLFIGGTGVTIANLCILIFMPVGFVEIILIIVLTFAFLYWLIDMIFG